MVAKITRKRPPNLGNPENHDVHVVMFCFGFRQINSFCKHNGKIRGFISYKFLNRFLKCTERASPAICFFSGFLELLAP
jgi:hypothetical protein